jgi:hypothetical protein
VVRQRNEVRIVEDDEGLDQLAGEEANSGNAG